MTGTPERVTLGPLVCLSVTGLGEPGGGEHTTAIGALYAVAAGLGGPAGPLEGLWWAEDERPPLRVPRELWRWHLLLPLPGMPEPGLLESAREQARPSGAAVDRVRVSVHTEGECVQLTHEGPFSEEHRTLAVMDAYMTAHHLVPNGPHHEIYLTPLDAPGPAPCCASRSAKTVPSDGTEGPRGPHRSRGSRSSGWARIATSSSPGSSSR